MTNASLADKKTLLENASLADKKTLLENASLVGEETPPTVTHPSIL